MPRFDDLTPSAKVRAFHEEHGQECYREGFSSMFYYADGAAMENDSSPSMCIFHSVPDASTLEGEYLLYWRQRKFAQLKLERAIKEFDELNTLLANGLPPDEDAALVQLRQLQKTVDERKRLVAQAEAALANTRKGRRKADDQREQEEQARRMELWNHRRRTIRI